MTLLQITISAITALAVVLLTNHLATRRERIAQRRDQRTAHLVTAYRAFSKASNHPAPHQIGDEIQLALIDTQLFGTEEQISLAQQFAKALRTQPNADLDNLLQQLRAELREELALPSTSTPIHWIRIDPPHHDRTQ